MCEAAAKPASMSPKTVRAGEPTPTALGFEGDAGLHGRSNRLRLVLRPQQRRPLGRSFERFGHHQRDGLIRVAHEIVLQHLDTKAERRDLLARVVGERRPIGWRHDLDNSRMRLRRGDVERFHFSARDLAHRRHGVEHSLGMIVRGIGRTARDLEQTVAARQGLTGAGAETTRLHKGRSGFKRHRGLLERSRMASPEGPASRLVSLPPPRRGRETRCGARARS